MVMADISVPSVFRHNVHSLHVNGLLAAEGFKKPPGDVGGNSLWLLVALEVLQYCRGNGFAIAEMKMQHPEVVSGRGQPGFAEFRKNQKWMRSGCQLPGQ